MFIVSYMMERFYTERNSSYNTRLAYNTSVQHFEKIIGLPLDNMIHVARQENKKDWQETKFRQWLIEYRNWNYNKFKENTAKANVDRVKTVFRHFGVTIGDLPYFSTKQVRKSEIIDYEDLPNRQMLKLAIETKNPLLKALTLFMSSTGLSRIDTFNLTIQDYLDSTYEYHETDNIYEAIKRMNECDVSIVPTFKFPRRKTGEIYRTFASPESVKAINNYILSRTEALENHHPLFGVSFRYFNDLFKETNKKLGFGTVNGVGRFTPQMLRSYHASQLAEAGMNDSLIDLLQGRKPQSIARRHYIRVKREKLREEYIRCLPYLVVEDIEEVKTELDVTKEQLEEANNKNIELENNINGLWEELNNVKKRQDIWESLKNGE